MMQGPGPKVTHWTGALVRSAPPSKTRRIAFTARPMAIRVGSPAHLVKRLETHFNGHLSHIGIHIGAVVSMGKS